MSKMDVFILIAMADGPVHGYAAIQAVRDRSDGAVRVSTGSFYRRLSLLMNDGLVEEAAGNPAKRLEIARPQRVGQRQHLQRAGHALHLGVEHETNAAHGFENPLRGVLAVLLVIAEDDDGRKNDQRQRGSRNQKS